MATDAMVKLTKAGATEPVSKAHEMILAPAVQREAIEQGKAGGHGDALLIEQNVRGGRVALRGGRRLAQAEVLVASMRLSPGEEDALRLYLTARADVVVSDDFDFLRKLRSLQVPMLTPAALLVDMVQEKALTKDAGLRLLQQLAPHIADEEYFVARTAMEAS